MPNWCTNRLTVEGPLSEMERFEEQAERVGDAPLSFEAFVAPPDAVARHCRRWYQDNWGVAQDAQCVEVVAETTLPEGERAVEYLFDTPWRGPVAAVKQMAGLYPSLRFSLEWEEPGNGIFGCLKCAGGGVVREGSGTEDVAEFHGEAETGGS